MTIQENFSINFIKQYQLIKNYKMINLFKNLLNIGYHLNIKNIKVLRYSSQ